MRPFEAPGTSLITILIIHCLVMPTSRVLRRLARAIITKKWNTSNSIKHLNNCIPLYRCHCESRTLISQLVLNLVEGPILVISSRGKVSDLPNCTTPKDDSLLLNRFHINCVQRRLKQALPRNTSCQTSPQVPLAPQDEGTTTSPQIRVYLRLSAVPLN